MNGASIIAALVALAVWPGAAMARTFAIHAAGIDPDDAMQNHGEFYQEASDFSSYCSKAGDVQCQLFIDPDPSKTRQGAGINFAKLASHSEGAPTSDSVLRAFEQALDRAQPGDQVAFTIADHGWVEGGAVPDGHGTGNYGSSSRLLHFNAHTSCIALAGSHDDICADDLAKILAKHKKPGVRVLIGGEACFSGAFAALGNQEVCTYTEADRWRMGAGGDSLWSQVKTLKKSGTPLSLTELRHRGHWVNEQQRGGGFGSQTVRTRLCNAGGLQDPTVDFSNVGVNHEDRETLGDLASDRGRGNYADSLSRMVCRFDPTGEDISILQNMSRSIARINGAIGPEIEPIRQLARNRCGVIDPPQDPCSAIQDFELKIDRFQHYATRAQQIHDHLEETQNALSDLDEKLRNASGGNAAQLRAKRGQLLEQYYQARANEARELRDSYPVDDSFLTEYNIIAENLCVRLAYPGEPHAADRAYSLNGQDPRGVTQEDLDQAQACEDSFHL